MSPRNYCSNNNNIFFTKKLKQNLSRQDYPRKFSDLREIESIIVFQVVACGHMNEDGVDEFGSGTFLYSGIVKVKKSGENYSLSADVLQVVPIL